MKKTLILFSILLTGLFLLIGNTHRSAQAQEPLAISLSEYNLSYVGNGVEIYWATETEFNTAGYKLERGQNGNFSFLQNPSGNGDLFIPAFGDVTTGAEYSFVDETAVIGNIYTYNLYEVTTDSNISTNPVATATISLVPTATPIAAGGGNNPTATNTPVPQPTNTTVPTNTPALENTSQPTATAVSQNNATAVPTSTSVPPTQQPTAVPIGSDPLPTATTAAQTATDTGEGNGGGADTDTSNQEKADAAAPQTETIETEPVAEESAAIAANSLEAAEVAAAPETSNEAITQENSANPSSIGTNALGSNNTTDSNSQQESQDNPDADNGSLYLWGGFIAAIFIFITVIYGSIVLFTRRKEK